MGQLQVTSRFLVKVKVKSNVNKTILFNRAEH